MSRKTRRFAALAGALVAVGAMFVATTAASAITIDYTFKNWALWGSLTPKKLNEPITLPPGSTFNGTGELVSTPTSLTGTVTGSIFVPPFNAALTVLGIPTSVGATFTQVGKTEGSIAEAPTVDCASSHFAGNCVTLTVDTKAEVGVTALGILGIEIPTHCEIVEPVDLDLKETLPLAELLDAGSHFGGSTNIPAINCGLSGLLLSPLLTALMSGPDNSYALHIGPNEPAPPTVVTQEASSASQISAKLHATVNPNGEPESGCRFEYGTSTSYGASIPCEWAPGAGFNVYAPITGLSEDTTYHYRIVATNTLGTSYGSDETVTTLSGAPEYGSCVAQKNSRYTDSGCQDVAEKKGVPDDKGSFEWMSGPSPTCVARKKGEYTNSDCTAKAVKAGKGAFEKAPGPGFTSASETVTLQTPGLDRTVVCAASTGAGEVTGLSTSIDRITFTGCESAGKRCASEGPDSTPSGRAGVIVTNLLRNRLLGPVAGQVWTELASSEHEPYSAEFGCEGVRFRTKGSLAGVQAGDVNTPSATSTTTFTLEEGEQALSSEVSETGGKSWVGPDPTSEAGVMSNTAEAQTEIKS
ncbi:MAG: hypothetical protein ACLP1Q_19485 [Solirubrobacteraceae bacterium]